MKYILLTGSSGGIGKATALKFLSLGYFVIGTDILESDIKDKNFKFVKANLTNDEDLKLLKEEILKITKRLDAIYNLAGIFMMETMIEGSEEDLRKILEINFFSVYKLNRLFFDLLDKKSRIIIFSSEVARYSPQPFNGYYSLSKVMVDTYADILRRELNYLDIKVIKVQSGAIKTNLLTGVNSKYEKLVKDSKYYKKPLTKLKKLMDDEINKQVDPMIVANKLVKLISIKHPKIMYKIKNSFKLGFLDSLPEKLQDDIYKTVIK